MPARHLTAMRETVASERNERPWGYYQTVDEGDGFLVKRICIAPGQRLSYQRHRSRAEHWFVVQGECVATIDDVEHRLSVGAMLDIPVGTAHRAGNEGSADLLFIEVQTGGYLDEDDIERLEDDYDREIS